LGGPREELVLRALILSLLGYQPRPGEKLEDFVRRAEASLRVRPGVVAEDAGG